MDIPCISGPLWSTAFGDEERPTLYSANKTQKGDFAALTPPKSFMKDLETLSYTQLYALAENCQLALKTAQDEYSYIEVLIRRLEQKDSPAKSQALLDVDQHEEEKEATLYGYKRIARGMPYTRTKDGTEFYGFQDPFSQGGFVPTEAQYKRMKANAKDPKNIDDWTPIERDGKQLIPRMPRSPPPRQRGFTGVLSRPSRKRRFVEQGFSDTDATAALSDSDGFNTPTKRATRFLGLKIPPTRGVSETPTSNCDSPTSRHRGQHKFVVNNLTPALISLSASGSHQSANITAESRERSPTLSATERRRIASNSHPKPHLAVSTGNNRRSSPSASQIDPEEKKWTDVALISAINADHSFLHPDPAMALVWKNAILNAPNPVRSYAMKRKWAWWKKGGMDKRPRRGLREGSTEGDDSEEGTGQTNTEVEINGRIVEAKVEESGPKEVGNVEEYNEVKPPWPALLPDPFQPRFFSSAEPTDTKQTAETARRQQQKDGQFTFKLDPPLKSAAHWSGSTIPKAQGHEIPKFERLSPTFSSVGPPPLKMPQFLPN